MSDFVLVGDQLVARDRIRRIDARGLAEDGTIDVHVAGEPAPIVLEGNAAFDLVMRHAPQFVEGRRFRWQRSAWAFHNLVAHPLLQLLAWMGRTELGLRIHDASIPRPRPR